MKIRLRGRFWRLLFTSEGLDADSDGDCDKPNAYRKTIRIHPDLKPEREFDVLIHEMLHACSWDLSEEAVEETASDIARALWRLGYRKQEPRG